MIEVAALVSTASLYRGVGEQETRSTRVRVDDSGWLELTAAEEGLTAGGLWEAPVGAVARRPKDPQLLEQEHFCPRLEGRRLLPLRCPNAAVCVNGQERSPFLRP